jgi:hypothetical protein
LHEFAGILQIALEAALQSYVLPMLDTATRRTETRAAWTGRSPAGHPRAV